MKAALRVLLAATQRAACTAERAYVRPPHEQREYQLRFIQKAERSDSKVIDAS
jgi:hypothetical protein